VKQWGNAVFSGNAVIDAIINAKYYLIQDSEIQFHYEGQLPAHIDFDSAGLSSIVSNLLDNAINACNKLPEEQRSIDFSVLLRGSDLLISCKNPTMEQAAPVPKAPDLSSEHGWGLTILQQLADRYSGRMELRNETGTFQAALWIPLAYEKELAH
jgi:two-component system, LytTR family, sensor histidine kinase AgrC